MQSRSTKLLTTTEPARELVLRRADYFAALHTDCRAWHRPFVIRASSLFRHSSFVIRAFYHIFLNTQMNNITTVSTVNTNSTTPETHPASSLSTGAIGGRGGSSSLASGAFIS
jgi:hypothetical protein